MPVGDLKLAASSSLPPAQTTTTKQRLLQQNIPQHPITYISTQNPHNNLPNMSGAAQGSASTTKAVTTDSKDTSQPLQPQKPGAQLEEDDEFEDFPVEGT